MPAHATASKNVSAKPTERVLKRAKGACSGRLRQSTDFENRRSPGSMLEENRIATVGAIALTARMRLLARLFRDDGLDKRDSDRQTSRVTVY